MTFSINPLVREFEDQSVETKTGRQPTAKDRFVYADASGNRHCVSGLGIADISPEFIDILRTLCGDLQVAVDCIGVWGGVPIPVAHAILRNLEPARAAVDLAIRTRSASTVGKKAH